MTTRRAPRRRLGSDALVRLYVEPMDAVVVDVSPDGQIKLENEEDWSKPTLQERRAILYAATNERAALDELIEILEHGRPVGPS